jgi:DNA invertase Pin-like site-specific DNA recombinase
MGDTFRFVGGVDAVERDFGDGGTSSIRRRLLEGEGMSDVCREFGISRKTGYKIFNRYKDEGLEALTDRSRRPVRYKASD